jgi:DNA-binding transcriptional MerR regulator
MSTVDEPNGREDKGPEYAIGTVAGLTGLDPHSIRAWERRYGAVRPQRSPKGRRYYGAREVARLQLLKALVDSGEAIGQIAMLEDDALRERLSHLAGLATSGPRPDAKAPLTLALLAPGIESQLGVSAAALGRLRVTLVSRERADFVERLAAHPADVIVAELRSLGAEPLRALEEIRRAAGTRLVLLLYDFAPGIELARLARGGAHLVRGPIRLAQLRQSIEDLLAIDAVGQRGALRERVPSSTPGANSPRRFSDEQLSALLETASGIRCECPSHLASLVSSLVAFELYSRDCESLGDNDAALHRHLAASSSRLRAELEELLDNVVRLEGIRV